MPDPTAWKVGSFLISQWDYTAGSNDEVTVKENEPLILQKIVDPSSPWVLVKRKSDGVEGYIPTTYLEKTASPPPSRPPPSPRRQPAQASTSQPSVAGGGSGGTPRRKKRTLEGSNSDFSARRFPSSSPPRSVSLYQPASDNTNSPRRDPFSARPQPQPPAKPRTFQTRPLPQLQPQETQPEPESSSQPEPEPEPEPETQQPETQQPETQQPETQQPETQQPEPQQPEIQPEPQQPEPQQPEPETQQPEPQQPEPQQPEPQSPSQKRTPPATPAKPRPPVHPRPQSSFRSSPEVSARKPANKPPVQRPPRYARSVYQPASGSQPINLRSFDNKSYDQNSNYNQQSEDPPLNNNDTEQPTEEATPPIIPPKPTSTISAPVIPPKPKIVPASSSSPSVPRPAPRTKPATPRRNIEPPSPRSPAPRGPPPGVRPARPARPGGINRATTHTDFYAADGAFAGEQPRSSLSQSASVNNISGGFSPRTAHERRGGLRPSNTEFREQDLARPSNSTSENVDESSLLDQKEQVFHNLARWLADRPSVEQVSTFTGGIHVVTSASNLKAKTKETTKPGIFGMALEDVYARGGGSSVPVVVIQCVDYLMGIGEAKLEGVFRIPGNKQKILRLKEAYMTPKTKVYYYYFYFSYSFSFFFSFLSFFFSFIPFFKQPKNLSLSSTTRLNTISFHSYFIFPSFKIQKLTYHHQPPHRSTSTEKTCTTSPAP